MTMPPKTRLLIIAGNSAFVRVFLQDQIRLLASTGYEICLICSIASEDSALLQDLDCTVKSINIPRAPKPLADLRSLSKLVREVHAWKPHIVHVHTPKAALLGSLAGWVNHVPIRIQTIHGLRSEGMSGASRAVIQSMERLTAAFCTISVAVSSSLRLKLIEQGIVREGKVVVAGYGGCAGVPIELFNPEALSEERAEWRKTHRIDDDDLLITCIGRIARDKGISVLAKAWVDLRRKHEHLKLLIAGPLDVVDPVDLLVLNQLRSDSRVILLEVFQADVRPLLAASDIFVQPSFREGLSAAALEASAMGLPVVASRVTGLIDAVRHGVTGLLTTAGDAEELSAALLTLIRQPLMRQRMGGKGRRFVTARFDRNIVLQQGALIYAEACAAAAKQKPKISLYSERAMALVLLVLLSPVMLLVAAVVFFFLGSPVIFLQRRTGLNGIPFTLLKFRTMRTPGKYELLFETDHLRITPIGRVLRRLSLDELPQLWNVLRGEMNIVGPRPLLAEYLSRYTPYEARRHDVKPGITGWAQVNGRNTLSWSSKFELDIWYVDNRSARLDALIILMTVKGVLWPWKSQTTTHKSLAEFEGVMAKPRPEVR